MHGRSFFLPYALALCIAAAAASFCFAAAYQLVSDVHAAAKGPFASKGTSKDRFWNDVMLAPGPVLRAISPAAGAWGAAAGVTLLILACYPLRRHRYRRLGGPGIATSLGAREIRADTTDLAERRLLEHAGRPVFVLDAETEATNAALVGTSSADAAIVVTRAARDRLTPLETQALMAHLETRARAGVLRREAETAALLSGFTLLYDAGAWLRARPMRAGGWTGIETSVRMASGLHSLIAFFLRLAGMPGLLAARMVLSRASRDKAFAYDHVVAADERLRPGIAALLSRLQGEPGFRAPLGVEFTHSFFADPQRMRGPRGVLQTHPSPAERLERIAPGFDAAAYHAAQTSAAVEGAVPAAFRVPAASAPPRPGTTAPARSDSPALCRCGGVFVPAKPPALEARYVYPVVVAIAVVAICLMLQGGLGTWLLGLALVVYVAYQSAKAVRPSDPMESLRCRKCGLRVLRQDLEDRSYWWKG